MGRVAPLAAAQRRALARLSERGFLDELYLAGGTGVALHLQHRRSVDLGLFSLAPDLDLESLADRLAAIGAATTALTDATLAIRLGGVPVDIVRYPYAPLAAFLRGPDEVRVASLRDLAAMKLSAIARRGIRRDFWDLHAIITEGATTLARVIDDYSRKFGVSRSDVYHVIRSLTWFDDAEQDRVMPAGLTKKHWTEIRSWFESEAASELVRRSRTRRRRSMKK